MVIPVVLLLLVVVVPVYGPIYPGMETPRPWDPGSWIPGSGVSDPGYRPLRPSGSTRLTPKRGHFGPYLAKRVHKRGEVLGLQDPRSADRSREGPGCDVEDSGHIGAQKVVSKWPKGVNIEARVVPVPHYSRVWTPNIDLFGPWVTTHIPLIRGMGTLIMGVTIWVRVPISLGSGSVPHTIGIRYSLRWSWDVMGLIYRILGVNNGHI